MNEAGYFGLVRDIPIEKPDGYIACTTCGDMKVTCYRFPYGKRMLWVYSILPCHACNTGEFEKVSHKGLQTSHIWVDQPVDQQKARIDRGDAAMLNIRARLAEVAPVPLPENRTEQPVNPVAEDAGDEVNEEF